MVAKKWVADDRSALMHWKKFGQFEDRIPGCTQDQVNNIRSVSADAVEDTALRSVIFN